MDYKIDIARILKISYVETGEALLYNKYLTRKILTNSLTIGKILTNKLDYLCIALHYWKFEGKNFDELIVNCKIRQNFLSSKFMLRYLI